MPRLLQLFQSGWTLDSPDKVCTGLDEATFAWGLPHKHAKQYRQLRLGYLLIKGVSKQHSISLEQAAEVVEVWRENRFLAVTAAAITDNGVVAWPQAWLWPAAGVVVHSLLPHRTDTWTMYKLCEQAATVACVKEQSAADRRAAAWGEGGRVSKKQRTNLGVVALPLKATDGRK